ncbi:MAG: hypothetical protein KF729_00005 [Sandaracinaceae bacterium]|nr:hypothetical protein [Sandaracinaceae bacterium]
MTAAVAERMMALPSRGLLLDDDALTALDLQPLELAGFLRDPRTRGVVTDRLVGGPERSSFYTSGCWLSIIPPGCDVAGSSPPRAACALTSCYRYDSLPVCLETLGLQDLLVRQSDVNRLEFPRMFELFLRCPGDDLCAR